MLKRYAPASVRFDDAQPAPLDAIHAGDQLRSVERIARRQYYVDLQTAFVERW